MSKILSQRGEIDMIVDDDVDVKDFDAMCVLHNTITNTKSKPMRIQQALKWGYWEDPPESEVTTEKPVPKAKLKLKAAST